MAWNFNDIGSLSAGLIAALKQAVGLGAPATTDVAPTAAEVHGGNASPQATGGNQTGADLNLSGGIGSRFFTVVDFSGLAGKIITIIHTDADGEHTNIFTEGVDWTAATSNAATAASIAAMTGEFGTFANVGDVAYLTPPTSARTLTISTNGGADLTATSGADGALTILNVLTIRSPEGGNDLDLVGVDQGGILIVTEQTTPGEVPGGITVRTADAVGSAASNIQISAGDSDTADAGHVSITSGTTGTSTGAELILTAATPSNASNIHITAGDSADVGGNILLSPGDGTNSNGNVKVNDSAIFNSVGIPLYVGSSQISIVDTQFDVTNSTSLVNVTGLTASVDANDTYTFRATLYTVSDVGTGVKVAIGGTCTATVIIYEASTQNAGAITQGRTTTKGNAVGGVTAVTAARIDIFGTIEANAAGTLTVQFAENAAIAVTTSSVLVGSSFTVTKAVHDD